MRTLLVATSLLLATGIHAQDVVVQRLAGHDTNSQDRFGYSVDVRVAHGETLLLVGAPGGGASTRGAAYVFRLDTASGLFTQEAQLAHAIGASHGEDVALLPPAAPDGQWLALDGGGLSGRLWRRSPGGAPNPRWSWMTTFIPPGGGFEYGGRAAGLARDGDGAEFVVLSETDSLFVWRHAPGAPYSASGWTLDAGLSSPAAHVFSLSTKTMAVWTGDDGTVRIAALVFAAVPTVVVVARDRTTGAWAEEGRLTSRLTVPGHEFGFTLSAAAADAGDVVIVGAPYRRSPYNRAGQAYVFRRDPATGAWAEEQFLTDPTSAPFGLAVAADRGLAVALGAPLFRVYRDGGGGVWTETGAHDWLADDADINSGASLAGPYFAFGNAYENGQGFESGWAWVYTLPWMMTPSDPGAPAIRATLTVAPNPSAGRAAVTLTLERPSPSVRVSVFDVLGREVAVLLAGPLAAGSHTWSWASPDGARLASGVYVVRAEGAGVSLARRVSVVR